MRSSLVLALAASVALLAQAADARSRDDRRGDAQRTEQREPQEASRGQGRDPRREHHHDGSAAAAREAQQRNGGGRVLSVEPEGSGYRVKVLKDGEVRTHHVRD